MSVKSEQEIGAAEKAHWEEWSRRENPRLDRGGIRKTHAAGFFAGMKSKGAKPPAPQPAPGKAIKERDSARRRYKLLNRRLQSIKRLHSRGADGFCDECELEYPCLTITIIEGKHRPTEEAGG